MRTDKSLGRWDAERHGSLDCATEDSCELRGKYRETFAGDGTVVILLTGASVQVEWKVGDSGGSG